MTRPTDGTIKALTARELVIAECVSEGHKGQALLVRLAERGQHMAAATVETRIRDIAWKLDNPHGLPPRALITLWARTRRVA